jgi:large subunit ribosomal protein L23
VDDYQVIIRPLITEKGTHSAEKLNAYPFEVNPGANKVQIRQAIERIYGVRVKDVRTQSRRGKPRRVRYTRGRTRQWKKAIVVLHEDDHLDLF